jgi:uncharacterized Zn-binding protein involved in type VI secretion
MGKSMVSLKGHEHWCPMVEPGPRPHIGGPVLITNQNFVRVNGVPVATVGDRCLCSAVPTTSDAIAAGSSIARINGREIARVGDRCSHGGHLLQGLPWMTSE